MGIYVSDTVSDINSFLTNRRSQKITSRLELSVYLL